MLRHKKPLLERGKHGQFLPLPMLLAFLLGLFTGFIWGVLTLARLLAWAARR